jgi:hypothetical protein
MWWQVEASGHAGASGGKWQFEIARLEKTRGHVVALPLASDITPRLQPQCVF